MPIRIAAFLAADAVSEVNIVKIKRQVRKMEIAN
jgi:hypothetical protein